MMMLERLKPNKNWYAVATIVGSTVGIGLYGIPFAFQKAGFGIGLLFLLGITGLMLFSHFLYGEVILRTHKRHQFVGYVNQYLGPWAKRLNLLIFWVAIYGSLVGVIIISGDFLANIFSSYFRLSPFGFSTVFIIAASVFIFMGLKTVSKFDYVMMLVFGAIVALIGIYGLGHFDVGNFTIATGDFWFLPFGVILFAMSGITGVPLAREVLIGEEEKFKKIVILGTLVPSALYLIFSLIVVGVSGDITSPDAISGLRNSLGQKVVFIGSVFGFLTSSTIFLNLATSLKESFQQDFHFKHSWSWLLVVVPPYLLFLIGVRNFIDIISLVGGLAVSVSMILLVFTYINAKKHGDRVPEYSVRFHPVLLYLIVVLFGLGAAYTILVK
ncbi:MAG: aromatic amino acid transport family protein [Candidatus Paceibacterota bacterium]